MVMRHLWYGIISKDKKKRKNGILIVKRMNKFMSEETILVGIERKNINKN
jgi:hypothetical protein